MIWYKSIANLSNILVDWPIKILYLIIQSCWFPSEHKYLQKTDETNSQLNLQTIKNWITERTKPVYQDTTWILYTWVDNRQSFIGWFHDWAGIFRGNIRWTGLITENEVEEIARGSNKIRGVRQDVWSTTENRSWSDEPYECLLFDNILFKKVGNW